MTEKLSPFHATILIYMTQIGMGLFTLPRLLAEKFGTNGWLMLPIAFLLSTLNILLIAVVYHLAKGRSIFKILEQSIPKFILYPLYSVLIGIWSVTGCLIAKYYIIVFQMVAYPTANPTIFKFIVDVLLFLLIIKGIYNIAKAATIFHWLTVPLLLLMLFYFRDFDWARLTPFVFRDHHMSVSGALNLYFNFIGFEVGLLLFPYINRKTKLIKSLLVSNSMVTIVYIYVTFITFGFYGYKHLSTLQFPILNILAYVQLPFVQGTENLFYGFFLFSILITAGMYLWAALETTQSMIRAPKKLLALILVIAVFGIALIPNTLVEVMHWTENLGYLATGIAIGFPILLIILLLTQRIRGETT
ncbi:GerAB/ArcD/ProY family transporter [Paenibacillus humicus]|uniref:GerAB/ArcD/ProY family transporter n=1 Tax=Paenibacillus humicus TaxID=412861 RepID=UPI003D26708F